MRQALFQGGHRVKRLLLLGMPLVLSLGLVGCSTGAEGPITAPALLPVTQPTITALAAQDPRLTTLTTALQLTGLDIALEGAGPFTVLAPTDAAFARLPTVTLNSLLADPQALGRVLQYHVFPGLLLQSDLAATTGATSLLGVPVTVATVGGGLVINPNTDNARFAATDIRASNGVVHLIDTVLIP